MSETVLKKYMTVELKSSETIHASNFNFRFT